MLLLVKNQKYEKTEKNKKTGKTDKNRFFNKISKINIHDYLQESYNTFMGLLQKKSSVCVYMKKNWKLCSKFQIW